MDFQGAVAVLSRLLSRKRPETFNSSWILRHAPGCYRFIRKEIRAEVRGIDWDKVTSALEPKYQRRWTPRPQGKCHPYRSKSEINLILNKYRDKLYVFIAPIDAVDRRVRDRIAISLVRVAQAGNLLAKAEVIKLAFYTIDEWLDTCDRLSRWKGHDNEIREEVEGCVRRYRYTGSFFSYVFRTLECAGRRIRPFYACSLDEPIGADARERKIGKVVHDPELNEIRFYEPGKLRSFDSESTVSARLAVPEALGEANSTVVQMTLPARKRA